MSHLLLSQSCHAEAMQDRDCTLDKINNGYYLGALKDLAAQSGINNVAERTKRTKNAEQNAYLIAQKDVKERSPLEENLLLSIVFKALSKVDARIARSFPVLSKLITRVKAAIYMKHDLILQP